MPEKIWKPNVKKVGTEKLEELWFLVLPQSKYYFLRLRE
jgi:hypothetical protein